MTRERGKIFTLAALAALVLVMTSVMTLAVQNVRAEPGVVTITVVDRATGLGVSGAYVWIGFGYQGGYKKAWGNTDASGQFKVDPWTYGDNPPYGSWYAGATKSSSSSVPPSEPGWRTGSNLVISGGSGSLTLYLTKFQVLVQQYRPPWAGGNKALQGVTVKVGYGYTVVGLTGTTDSNGIYCFWAPDYSYSFQVSTGVLVFGNYYLIPVPPNVKATLTISDSFTPS